MVCMAAVTVDMAQRGGGYARMLIRFNGGRRQCWIKEKEASRRGGLASEIVGMELWNMARHSKLRGRRAGEWTTEAMVAVAVVIRALRKTK